MRLIRPWLKAELESILQDGVNDEQPSHRRFRNRSKKQHVQCVEVDEKRSALKINDTDSMVWCFVSTPGMNNVSDKMVRPRVVGVADAHTAIVEVHPQFCECIPGMM